MFDISNLPRKLDDWELEILFQILPQDKPKYNAFRKNFSDFFLIGTSRFGEGNYILANKNDKVDLTAPASNVFAAGIVITDKDKYDITIHEVFENEIEIDFISEKNKIVTESEKIIDSKSYSNWKPGDKSPFSNSNVREVHLIKNEVVIAVCSDEKKIWTYDASTQFNFVIPLTNFYNEIIRVKGERNPETALKPKLLFEKPEMFTDEEIGQGFLLYNKFMKKMNIDYSIFKDVEKQKTSFWDKIFGRNK